MKIIADSVNPLGQRITTIEFELPKFLVAQFNTHSMIRRNSASSRAIPVWKVIQQVEEDPYIPEVFGAYSTGMQPQGEADQDLARFDWLIARDNAVRCAINLAYGSNAEGTDFVKDLYGYDLEKGLPSVEPKGVAKEIANRVLEPWMKTRIVATSTNWGSFIEQRNSGAQRELAQLATQLREALTTNAPVPLEWGAAHAPYSRNIKESVAACAAVSYKNRSTNPDLYDRLLKEGHPSPFEHYCYAEEGRWGAYTGWRSEREILETIGKLMDYNGKQY